MGGVPSGGSIPNFMTDVASMRDYAGRFATHSDIINEESNRAWMSAQNVIGPWHGDANRMSTMTMEEMMRAFRNIRDMTTWASQNLAKSADTYEEQELANKALMAAHMNPAHPA